MVAAIPHTSALVTVTSNSGAAAAPNAGTTILPEETLADAIAYSNNNPEAEPSGPNTITFASKITGIKLTAALPAISTWTEIYSPSSAPVTIDGSALSTAPVFVAAASGSPSTGTDLVLDRLDLKASSGAVGGIQGGANSAISADGSRITGAKGGLDGAIESAGAVELTGSTISGNAGAVTGGILLTGSGASLRLNDSTISGNASTTVSGGGALDANGGASMTIDNSTIADNTSVGSGAGISISGPGDLTLTASTVADNRSTGTGAVGGGIDDGAGGKVTIESSVIAANSASSDPDVYAATTAPTASFTLVGNASGSQIAQDAARNNQLGTSAKPIRPKLSSLGNHGGLTQTMIPLSGSPLIDKGKRSDSTDQRGVPRDVDFLRIKNARGGDGTDIGAVEIQAPLTPHRKRTGNQLATLWTPSLTTSTGSPNLPVKFASSKVHGAPNATLVKVQLRVDQGVNTTVRKSSGKLQLNIFGKRAGTHTVYARFTYTEQVGGHKRTVVTTVSAKFRVR